MSGEFLRHRPGPAAEPAGARAYGPGDDARRIDWNVTARSLAPQVRTTDADRELETWVVVDRSASLDFGTADREKRDVVLGRRRRLRRASPPAGGNRFGVVVAGGADGAAPPARRRAHARSSPRSPTVHDTPRHDAPPAPGADLAAALGQLAAPAAAAAARSSSSPTSSTPATGPRRCARWPIATR